MRLNPVMRSARGAWVWAALLAVGAPGCKKRPPPDPETSTQQEWGDVEQLLQVVAVEPNTIPAESPTTVQVLGAGFVDGASVKTDERQMATTWIDENSLSVRVPALPDGQYDITVSQPDGRSKTLHAALTVGAGVLGSQQACGALTVYFALDQAGLDEAARDALREPIACWTGQTYRITVEGHADERGTTDYNLALGQRRADSVRAHMVRTGIPDSRIETISYGEERPVDRAQNEAAWAKNRRAEIRPGR